LHDDRVKNVTEESVRKAAFARGSCGKEPWFKREMIVDSVWRIATRTTSGSGRSVHGDVEGV
jgi:hypothetical protein